MADPTHSAPSDSPGEGLSSRLSSRSIRSFVIRNGRMTEAQAEALERLWPCLGVDFQSSPIDLDALFGRAAPRWLEVGFGNGDALVQMARAQPELDFLGVEVHAPGVGHALLELEKHQLRNVRLIRHDAIEVLERMIPPAALARVLLFFPDPWIKKRHHKRRIVQRDFLTAASHALAEGALLHAATDITPYADWMLEQLQQIPTLRNTCSEGTTVPRPHWRPLTRFEQRGNRLGHQVHDLIFQKC